ncbi:MAG: FTR1 family protein, partial [Candidatus Humimicrobiaceae bacterium]
MMLSSFFIAFREGLEAFLIVGIVISYLYKIEEKKYIKHAIFGGISAIVLSIIMAFIIENTLGSFEGRIENIYEGIVKLLAAVVLTYMVFWMNKVAKKIRSDIEIKVDKAIDKGKFLSLFLFSFIIVFREGAETVLFFRAISFQTNSKELIIGAVFGIFISVTLSSLFFLSFIRIKIGIFFRYTAIIVMLIGAGMLTGFIHEFQEAGLITILKDSAYNISHILSIDSTLGGILNSLFGYQPTPSYLEIFVYLPYIILIFFLIMGYRQSQEKYKLLFENANDGIYQITILGNYVDANNAFVKMLGYNNREELLSTKAQKEFYRFQEGKSSIDINENLFETQVKKKDGTKIWVEISYKTVHQKNKPVYCEGIVRDINVRKEAEEKIRYLTFHDKLTGLYNRAFFEEELKRLDTKRQLPLSIVMGDVNGLKLINDAFGHEKGDELLKKTAKVLTDCFRAEDIIARWGGDEFIIILPKTDEKNTLEIIKRIKIFCKKNSTKAMPLSISIGVFEKKDYSQKIEDIIKGAEDMMYR